MYCSSYLLPAVVHHFRGLFGIYLFMKPFSDINSRCQHNWIPLEFVVPTWTTPHENINSESFLERCLMITTITKPGIWMECSWSACYIEDTAETCCGTRIFHLALYLHPFPTSATFSPLDSVRTTLQSERANSCPVDMLCVMLQSHVSCRHDSVTWWMRVSHSSSPLASADPTRSPLAVLLLLVLVELVLLLGEDMDGRLWLRKTPRSHGLRPPRRLDRASVELVVCQAAVLGVQIVLRRATVLRDFWGLLNYYCLLFGAFLLLLGFLLLLLLTHIVFWAPLSWILSSIV